MVNDAKDDDASSSMYTKPASQSVDTNMVCDLVIIDAYLKTLPVLCAFRLQLNRIRVFL